MAGAAFHLRRARPSGAGRLAPLIDAYRRFYHKEPDRADARRFLAGHLSRRRSVVFFVSEGSLIPGFVQLYPCFSSIAMRPPWILSDLFVAPEARQRGLARAPRGRAKEFARESRASGLRLETATGNRKAQRL